MINIVVGLIGLDLVNVPMYIALRKQVTLIVFLWDYFALKKQIDKHLMVGVAGMTVGAIIAGVRSTQINDFTSNLLGFVYVLIADVFTAAALFNSSRLGLSSENFKGLGQCYYNSIVATPCLLALAHAASEPMTISTNPSTSSIGFLGMLTLCCLVGIGNNYTMIACTTNVSPMAASVSGQLKDFALLLFGFLLFNTETNFWFVAGLCVSMVSAVYYAWAKVSSTRLSLKAILPLSKVSV